jgi:hypothetical protein
MSRNERKKLLKTLADMGTALSEATAVAESLVATATESQALAQRSAAVAESWRRLAEAAENRPAVVEVVLVPCCGDVN